MSDFFQLLALCKYVLYVCVRRSELCDGFALYRYWLIMIVIKLLCAVRWGTCPFSVHTLQTVC